MKIYSNKDVSGVSLHWLLFCAVFSVTGWAHAFSLGSSQGKAYIGKPFKATFNVGLDRASTNPADNCLSAKLYYGDNQIVNARTAVKAASYGQQSRVTVSSRTPVNEPIVAVKLKGGCNATFQRKYSFFSELGNKPSRSVAQVAPTVVAPSYNYQTSQQVSASAGGGARSIDAPTETSVFATPQNYNNTPAQRMERIEPSHPGGYRQSAVVYADDAPVGVGQTFEVPPTVDYDTYLRQQRENVQRGLTPKKKATRTKNKKRTKRRSTKQKSKQSTQSNRATQKSKPTAPIASTVSSDMAAVSKPRLTLSSIDWTQESGEVALRPSLELLTPVAVDESKREQARQLWRQINAGSGEAILAADSAEAVNADFLTLTKNIKNKEEEIAALQTELAQLREGKPSSGGWLQWLPYLLGLLLLGTTLYFWSRLRQIEKDKQERKTWGYKSELEATGDDASVFSESEEDTDNEGSSLRYQSKVLPSGGKAIAGATGALVTASGEGDAVDTQDDVEVEASDFSRLDDQLSAKAALESSAKAEELFDVQQQADFFLALGQEEQAIEILENYISEKPHASALAYLDLFGIYHSLGKEEEFVGLRERFNSLFNAEVPEYENYRMDSRGLETYENVIARIQSHWGTPKAVQLIEESVFREPDVTDEDQAFDPLAYRELLLLYGIAAEIAGTDSDLVRLGEKRFGESAFDITDAEAEELLEEDDYSSTKIQGLTKTPQVYAPKPDPILKNVALVSSTAVKDINTVIDTSDPDFEELDESTDLDFNLDIFDSVEGEEVVEAPSEEVVDVEADVQEFDLDFELIADAGESNQAEVEVESDTGAVGSGGKASEGDDNSNSINFDLG